MQYTLLLFPSVDKLNLQMKEMGLPLGFLNTTPFEVEESEGVMDADAHSEFVSDPEREKAA